MSYGFGPFQLDIDEARLWRGELEVKLRPKTFDILVYLVGRAGELVTKDELVQAVWPDTMISDSVLTASMSELRKALGETARAPQFIATVHRRGYRFIAALTMLVPALPPPVDQDPDTDLWSSPFAVRSAVPPQTTLFVGREGELSDILTRIEDPSCRLLTLLGPGGIGKTRLAIQVAQTLEETQAYDDRVHVISLAAVSAADRFIYALAEGLGFEFRGLAVAQEQLLGYLKSRQLLLILDNVEHLLSEVEFITDMLRAAPGLTILATSREAFNIQEEWLYPVKGMTTPGTHLSDPHTIVDYDAVRLFDQCARRVQPTFSLCADAVSVGRICQLVDGLPLAIELAAGWLNVVPPDRLVQELEQALDILTSRRRNTPERHRSMRGVLTQSWALLAERDREVLQCLALFRGGFQLEAAEVVAGATLDIMATLVATSWLRVESGGRYYIHELLRQFADEQLRMNDESAQTARKRHSLYYLELVKTHVLEIEGQDQQAALARVVDEIENVRTGWFWAVECCDADAMYWGALGLFRYYQIRGQAHAGNACFRAGAALLQPSATTSTPDPELVYNLCKILEYQGVLCRHLGDYDHAVQYSRDGLHLAKQYGWKREVALTGSLIGVVDGYRGNWDMAQQRLRQSLSIFRDLNDQHGVADMLEELGLLSGLYGDYDRAYQYATESLTVSREIQRPDWIGYSLLAVGWTDFCRGDYAQAVTSYGESYEHFTESGHILGQCLAQHGQGMVQWGMGQWDDAYRLISQGLDLARQHGFMPALAEALGSLSRVALDRAEVQDAVAYAREGLAIAMELGHVVLTASNLCALAAATLGQSGDLKQGYLTQALKVAEQAKLWSFLMLARFHLATSLVQEAQAASDLATAQSLAQQAASHLAEVCDHPSSWSVIRMRAHHLRESLSSELY